MNIYLKATYENNLFINIERDLILRAKNKNILNCYFVDENDSLIDITGAILFLTIKNKPSDTDVDAVLSKTIASVDLTDPMSGNAEIEITSTDCTSLLGNYIYSIKIKLSDGNIYTVSEGNLCFRTEITQREI